MYVREKQHQRASLIIQLGFKMVCNWYLNLDCGRLKAWQWFRKCWAVYIFGLLSLYQAGKKYFPFTASWIPYTQEAAWTQQYAGFFIFNVQLCDWSIHAQEVDVDLHVFQVCVAHPFARYWTSAIKLEAFTQLPNLSANMKRCCHHRFRHAIMDKWFCCYVGLVEGT